MKKSLRLIAVTLLINCLSLLNAYAQNDELNNVKAYINDVGNTAISVIKNSSLGSKEKETRLSKLFKEAVDIEWIGNFALGRYSKNITQEQRAQYKDLYSNFLINSYIPNFRDYTKETINITGATKVSNNEYLVQTEIIRPNKSPLRVGYLVRNKNPNYKIIDIIGEGVSLITTQRSEFGSILAGKGIKGLIEQLENKLYTHN